ncbi:MAG: hypothetical protein ACI8VE_002397, partial [Natrialbaceae archaeon]
AFQPLVRLGVPVVDGFRRDERDPHTTEHDGAQ